MGTIPSKYRLWKLQSVSIEAKLPAVDLQLAKANASQHNSHDTLKSEDKKTQTTSVVLV